jgi:hypothetical protein
MLCKIHWQCNSISRKNQFIYSEHKNYVCSLCVIQILSLCSHSVSRRVRIGKYTE